MFNHIAIVGATGAVGLEFLSLIAARRWNAEKCTLLASARSAGRVLPLGDRQLTVEELNESSFHGIDLALFSAGAGTSRKFAPLAANAGAVAVDNSSAFRMTPRYPW